MADLILVNGLPGVGKTTLAAKLQADLGLPALGKDMLKEFLFDTIGIGGKDDSRLIGKAVSEMMYVLAADYAAAGRSIILESAYFAEFARPAFQQIVHAHRARIIEVYCSLDPAERRRRFNARNASGQRHPGHTDGDLPADEPEPLEVYAPIGIGTVIRLDTGQFGDAEYAQLLHTLQEQLRQSA